jgi:hypothetical protein
MKTQRQFFLTVLLAIFALDPFSSASAEQFIANITLKKGERTALMLSSAYQSIMISYGSALPYSWKTDNDNICSVSSPTRIDCNIYAKSVGTTYIHYKGEYWSGTNTIEYSCYWFINVEPKDDGGGDDDDVSINYDDYTLPEESWGDAGNYTISWYNKNMTEFTISTNKELAGMAYLVNNQYADFEGKTIKLANNIDISGKKWKIFSIFKGTLDGQGHCISGLTAERGFIGRMVGATIRDLTMQGYIFINEPKADRDVSFTMDIGGLVGYAGASIIEKCRCEVNIIYKRTKALGNGNYPSDIHIGGLVGAAWVDSDPSGRWNTYIRYCTFEGEIKCRMFGEPVHIGGISGEANQAHIEYCENNASIISVESEGSPATSDHQPIAVCGINGDEPGTKAPDIICCRSICSFSVKHTVSANRNYPHIWIQGIGEGKAANCYSVIPSITISANSTCEPNYYGIGYYLGKGNYSNSDVNFQTTLDIKQSNSGSTAFSSAQMQTPAFLEELNMYPMLEMDGPVWTQDEGGFPYIAKLHEASAINPVLIEGKSNCAIYTLSGQRLAAPRTGINIIGGKKVITK